MANYESTFRSNYFKVKDPEAFQALMNKRNLDWREKKSEDGTSFYVFFDQGYGGGGMPFYDDDLDENFDFLQEVAEHLQKGEVCVTMEAGAEKLRYVGGYANAVNSKGEQLHISLEDIYDLVEKTWGIKTTDASY